MQNLRIIRASARVDHAKQAQFRVIPDTIHNYAHNNEWLIRNWHYVGKVNDAILMSKGLIDNPQHPKLNHYGRVILLLPTEEKAHGNFRAI